MVWWTPACLCCVDNMGLAIGPSALLRGVREASAAAWGVWTFKQEEPSLCVRNCLRPERKGGWEVVGPETNHAEFFVVWKSFIFMSFFMSA